MAANNYYTSSVYPSRPYHDYSNAHDQPLPPLSSSYSNSPYSSYAHLTPSQSYSGASPSDPYQNNDDIPLTGTKKSDAVATDTPLPPLETDDDMFIRDADPRKQRRKRKEGWFRGKITYVVFTLSVIQLIVFLAEIIKNGILTGSPIEIHPAFNPMIGPSPYVMINMGSRYVPCMHNVAGIQNSSIEITFLCPNATSASINSSTCSLSEICGFNGVPNPRPNGGIDQKPEPNQWWRFIVPIFLHAGIIHITFNLLVQLTIGRDIERLIGSVRFALVYFASGIFGFVLGGNFAATGMSPVGASGSLFGIIAITLLDLLYTWKQRTKPWMDLMFIFLDMVISFILGLLPYVDNFSHIGGFLMGIVLGICILRSPSTISRRTGYDIPSHNRNDGIEAFVRRPLSFFKDRQGSWWAWWLVRVAALVGVLICFILLLKNFYQWRVTCSWCKYLSCLPVTVNGQNWCDIGNLNITTTNATNATNSTAGGGNSKRMAQLVYDAAFEPALAMF